MHVYTVFLCVYMYMCVCCFHCNTLIAKTWSPGVLICSTVRSGFDPSNRSCSKRPVSSCLCWKNARSSLYNWKHYSMCVCIYIYYIYVYMQLKHYQYYIYICIHAVKTLSIYYIYICKGCRPCRPPRNKGGATVCRFLARQCSFKFLFVPFCMSCTACGTTNCKVRSLCTFLLLYAAPEKCFDTGRTAQHGFWMH